MDMGKAVIVENSASQEAERSELV